jgi:molybdopterin biosynthesis enzyme
MGFEERKITMSQRSPGEPHSMFERGHLDRGCDLILVSGGMSVDPDDITRRGIRRSGTGAIHYGGAALPGAMFPVADIDGVPRMEGPDPSKDSDL